MSDYSYEIEPRSTEFGGGWRLRLLEDGEEVGGGIFPPAESADDAEAALLDAYADALGEAQTWLATR